MDHQNLRDAKGNLIGRIETSRDKQVIRDSKGVFRGSYDQKSNLTRDTHGNRTGRGNFLTNLLDD
jgi:hypothetical protein